MKLYFENITTTVTTLLLLGLLGFVGYSIWNHSHIQFWGRRSFFLAIYGLLICCFAATRDGLHLTIQNAIDGSCTAGIFQLISVPTIVGCAGAGIILISGIVTIFAHSQQVKAIMFYAMSGGVLLKLVTVEIARIILY